MANLPTTLTKEDLSLRQIILDLVIDIESAFKISLLNMLRLNDIIAYILRFKYIFILIDNHIRSLKKIKKHIVKSSR